MWVAMTFELSSVLMQAIAPSTQPASWCSGSSVWQALSVAVEYGPTGTDTSLVAWRHG